jgi:hypothetical protein
MVPFEHQKFATINIISGKFAAKSEGNSEG